MQITQEDFDNFKKNIKESDKERTNVMMMKKVKVFLKEKYGTTSAGVNILALKDMGVL